MKILKTIFINIIVFFLFLIIIEIFFGSWFKNNFAFKLSSERNINRLYQFNFSNHKGTSRYIRDNNGFRTNGEKIIPSKIDIVFSGGSTTNQKFLNYNDTIVAGIQDYFKNLKIVNAGIDGLSIKGHINSFDFWFDKIKNLNPKYYIFYVGINDQNLLSQKTRDVDLFEESSFKNNLKEFMESNSFFYKNFRLLKTYSYLKFGYKKGINIVNKDGVVYGERSSKKFINYNEFEKNGGSIDKNYSDLFMNHLINLTEKTRKRGAKIIYITQISGSGVNKELYSAAETIMQHCKSEELICINLAKNSALSYDDFYDELHLNVVGSKKVTNYLVEELKKNLILN